MKVASCSCAGWSYIKKSANLVNYSSYTRCKGMASSAWISPACTNKLSVILPTYWHKKVIVYGTDTYLCVRDAWTTWWPLLPWVSSWSAMTNGDTVESLLICVCPILQNFDTFFMHWFYMMMYEHMWLHAPCSVWDATHVLHACIVFGVARFIFGNC